MSSAAIGKRFGQLKTRLGYGPRLVLHLIRKTVATLLEDAQPILGHDKPTMTYGLYSGGSSMQTRREWIEKAVRYDVTAARSRRSRLVDRPQSYL
jgi:integrase